MTRIGSYRWQAGREFVVEPRSETPEEIKHGIEQQVESLKSFLVGSDVDEIRLVDGNAYDVRFVKYEQGIAIRHFQIYWEGNGIGSRIMQAFETLSTHHGWDEMSIWIGNADDERTAAFLDKHGFDYSRNETDEAHGETFTGSRKI